MTTICNRLSLVAPKIGLRYISASHTQDDFRCKLLVLGGGTGGCSTAAKFAGKLGPGQVIVVEPSHTHYYQPLLTLVGGGVKTLASAARPMASVLPRSALWLQDSVDRIYPQENYITTLGGRRVIYEYLVVALGINMHFDKVEGLTEALQDPTSGVSSNYSAHYAERTFANLSQLKAGNAVFSFPNTPIKCAGAPIKACLISEHFARKAGVRNRVNFYYRTSLPVIFSVEIYARELLRLCEERGIEVSTRRELVQVDSARREAKFRALDPPHHVETIQYSMLHAVPPMGAPALLAASSPQLVDPSGYLKVNKATLRHEHFLNIFGIGDCTNLPTSKTAAAVAGQVGILEANLRAAMEGSGEVSAAYDGYTSCPLVTGYGSCIMAEFDYTLQPKETFPGWFDQSKEHLSMYLVKRDLMPHLYWHLMLKGHWNGPKTLRKLMHLGGN